MFADHVVVAIRKRRSAWVPVDLTNRLTLIDNLIFFYQVIVASEPMLERAILRIDGEIGDYYFRHLAEERHHAEWLAEDLTHAGVDVAREKVNHHAAELAGAQYYHVEHTHPCMLLGYMAALECEPMPVAIVEELERLHGVPLLRMVRHHAIHDQDHGVEVRAMLGFVPNGWREATYNNAIRTIDVIGRAAVKFGRR